MIDQDNRIEVKKIAIGRNLGSRLEVLSGLAISDRVVISPPDSLAAGDLVRVASGGATTNEKLPGADTDTENNYATDSKTVEPAQ